MTWSSKSWHTVSLVAILSGCGASDADGSRAIDEERVQQPRAARDVEDARGAESSAGDPEPRLQGEEEALEQDLALIAEARGWTLEEAREHYRRQQVMDDVVSQVYGQRREVFVGGALGEELDDPPRLYIKGAADDFVRGVVAAAPIEIIIVDRQPFSFDELDERVGRLMQELVRLGFDEASAGADIQREGLIEAAVRRQAGAPETVEEILVSLPLDLQTGVVIELSDEPVVGDDTGD